MNIGDRIKQKRKESNLTLEELGERTGLTRFLIHKYEKGIITNIPSDKIEKIADALSTSPAYLMGWEDDKPAKPVNELRFALQGKLERLTDEELEEMSLLADMALKRRKQQDK